MDDLSQLSHSDLYNLRGQPGADQKQLAPLEHRAFAREFSAEHPFAATPALLAAIPGYTLAKLVGALKTRSPASLDEISQGYEGLREGLAQALRRDELRYK